jgi:hypothetical protein
MHRPYAAATHDSAAGCRRAGLRLALCASIAVVVLAVGASLAQGATLTVTQLTDGAPTHGHCTLREAIENANADSQVSTDCPAGTSGSDTIDFAASGTVALKNKLPALTGPVVVDGSGQSVIISGRGVVDLFDTSYALSLSNLELTNGITGAITSTGPSLTLSGVTINASTNAGGGGAIANGSGTLQVTDSHFNGDTNRTDGGAISSAGPVTLTHDTFTKNSGNNGGAVNVSNSLTVTGSTFTSNAAVVSGGAIYESDLSLAGAVTISHSTFTGNKSSTAGGAVASIGPIGVTNSRFSSNTSGRGGAVATPTVFCVAFGCVPGPGPSSISGSSFSGNSAGAGGAVLAVGPLTVTTSSFSSNAGGAIDAAGGAVDNSGIVIPDPVSISRSTISGNTGTGLALNTVTGATVANSTFFGNSGSSVGGIDTDSPVTVSFTTFAANTGSQASDIGATATVNVRATIIGGGTGPDCSGTAVTDGGYNIASDGSCGLAAPTSQSSIPPGLSPTGLAANGGSTQTVALVPHSPALDAIPPSQCTAPAGGAMLVDQRAYARPADGNLDGVANCDVGAYESDSVPSGQVQPGAVFPVTTTADRHDPVCLRAQYGKSCSLHDALMMANASSLQHRTGATVTLARRATYRLTVVDNSSTSAGANALPVLIGKVLVNGAGAKIQRTATAPQMRLLQVARGARVKIVNAKLAGGKEARAGGGLLNFGVLTLVQSFVHGNSSGANGGGLFNAGTAVVNSSTFSANTATGLGGGFFNRHRLQVANSTVTGNKGKRAGAIASSAGAIQLINSTLSFDRAAQGAKEVAIAAGAISFANTIVGYAIGATNCTYGTTAHHTDAGHNIDSGTSCQFSSANASISDKSPGVGALAAHGGPTPTMSLKVGSPAINKGKNKVCKAAPIGNLDQRGVKRITATDRRCDIGAFEYQG